VRWTGSFRYYLNHVQILERRDDVFHFDTGLGGHVIDRQVGLAIVFGEQIHQNIRPVAPIRDLAQVREGLFGRPRNAFFFRQFVRERNDKLAVAGFLVLGKGQDTREIVPFRRQLTTKQPILYDERGGCQQAMATTLHDGRWIYPYLFL
jgi:hypothetical protein